MTTILSVNFCRCVFFSVVIGLVTQRRMLNPLKKLKKWENQKKLRKRVV